MTEYELGMRAQGGDIAAAVELADRYVANKTSYSLKQALPLLKQAADAGHAYAATKGAAVCIDMARWYESRDAMPEAFTTWESGLSFYQQALKTPANAPGGYRETAESYRLTLLYGAAACGWLTANYGKAFQYAASIGENYTRFNVLLALCKAYGTGDPMELHHVTELMMLCFSDKVYVSRAGVGRASDIEQTIFAAATRMYAKWLAGGLNGLSQSPETASAVTLMAYNSITSAKAKLLFSTKKK